MSTSEQTSEITMNKTTEAQDKTMRKKADEMWVIYVTGYGTFFFKGTRKAAEVVMDGWRAGWPNSIVRKRRATPGEIESNTPPRHIPAREQVKR